MKGREIVDYLTSCDLLDHEVLVNTSFYGDGGILLGTTNIAMDADGVDVYIGAEPLDDFVDRDKTRKNPEK